MKILKEWKELLNEYDSCSTEKEYHSFLLNNHDKIIKLYEFTNNTKYNNLVSLNNPTITSRGGKWSRGSQVGGHGQSISNPGRAGDIKIVFGYGPGEEKTRRIIYKVPGDDWPNSKSVYTVVVQFSKVGPSSQQLKSINAKDRLKQLDVMVKCDCPFFIWNGPEKNAKDNNYLYPASHGQTIGYNPTRSEWTPNRIDGDYANTDRDQGIRDPDGEYFICKHIAAVFEILNKWPPPISYFQASERAAAENIPDPGYPGTGEQPAQTGFVFPGDEEEEA